MKLNMKTILLLINGFGIEKKESYSIYDANIMPNFDKLMRQYLFSSLVSNVKNINDGYRNISLEMDSLYNYKVYKREMLNGKIISNETFLDMQKEIEVRKSKIHLFCFVDTSMDIVDNLKDYLKNINKEQDKKIFLHVVLTSNNYEDYQEIIEVLSKMNMELSPYAKIGMVLGLANILNSAPMPELNFFLRNMISELGEKWQSFKQKLDVNYGMKQAPILSKNFVVNSGFSIGNKDIVMFWNYDNVDLTNFINGIKSINYKDVPNEIKFYSLFPITYKEKIPYILNFEVAEKSLATNMQELGFKTLVMAYKNDINGINYFLNGMKMVNNPSITYLGMEDVLYNKEQIVKIINKYPHELVIINYDVGKASSVEELKDILNKIDDVLGELYENSLTNNCHLLISSLYATNRLLNNKSGEKCNIIYSKVPILYINNFVSRSNYLLSDGNISELLKLCYQSINSKYLGHTIVTKKNFLYKLIFK